MNNKVLQNYVFDASAQTVSAVDFTSIENILSILNVTTWDIIYIPNNATKWGSLSNNVLTLDFDTTAMNDTDNLQIIISTPVTNFKWSFAKVVASWVDTDTWTVIKTGTGMAIRQSVGNLVITTGTTAYSESIIRSNQPFSTNWIIRWGMQLSQRIANNNFAVEYVDVVGDGLSMTINSATSITVTKTAHGFSSSDIWKGMWIGNISVASCLPQRIVIASIPTVNTITFTVSWFPASWSGTCSLFWYNYHQVIYSGTTATALWGWYNTQRLGWQSAWGTATINTTAAPWHIGIIYSSRHCDASFLDQTQATWAAAQISTRIAANKNVPDSTSLYLQIRAYNWSTAPASTTTMTVWFVDAQMYEPQMVNISWIQSLGSKNSLPVVFPSAQAVTISSNTPVLAAGANLAADFGMQYRANATGASSLLSVLSPATPVGTSVKASAWRLLWWQFQNSSAAIKSVKFFNATSVTMWTTSAVFEVDIPAWWRTEFNMPWWIGFATWIMYAVTGAKWLTDNTAITLNDVSGSIFYA